MNLLFNATRRFGAPYIDVWLIYYLYVMMIGILIPKGSVFGIVFSIIIFCMSVYYGFINNIFRNFFNWIYLFCLYTFFLVLINSSEYLLSLRFWVLLATGILSLPAGFNIMGHEENIHRLWRILFIILHIYIINAIISNVFHLGGGYFGKGGDSYETGNLFSGALYLNIFIISLVPIFAKTYRNKSYLTIVSICAVLILVNMKRTPIPCCIVALVVYFLLQKYLDIVYGKINDLSKSGRYIFTFLLLFLVGMYNFQDVIVKQFESREEKMQTASLAEEGRVLELQYVFDEVVMGDNLVKTLIGKETFNTVGTYANGKFGKRAIHQDFTLLLHSTGIIGFVWFLGILFTLLYIPFRYREVLSLADDKEMRMLFAIYETIIIVYIVAMASGILRFMYSTSIFFLIIGLFLRIFYNQREDYLLKISNNNK